jgi:hypothetical protein
MSYKLTWSIGLPTFIIEDGDAIAFGADFISVEDSCPFL